MNNHSDYHSQALTLMDVLKATGTPPVELVQTVIALFGKEALRPFPEAADHESALYVIRLLHHKYKVAPFEAVQWAFDLAGPGAMRSSKTYSFVTARYGCNVLDEKSRLIEANRDTGVAHLKDLDQIQNNIQELAQGNCGEIFRCWYTEPSEDAREWILWAAGPGALPIEIVGIRRTEEAAQALVLKDQMKFRKQWPSLLKEAERLMKKHKQQMKKNAKNLDQEGRELLQDRLEMDEKVIEYLQVALDRA